jgi:hypothetical protein
MPRCVRIGRAVAVLVLACASLATQGCITHRNLATSAITFNKAVEEAQNEMLLLNALRASERRPMYITGISQVTGSVRTEVSAGLDIPFGKDADRNAASPRVTYGESPTFTVPVLDTQEFVQGFLNPVKTGSLAYYWDQGWPRSLLMHLLVQRIKVRAETASSDGKPLHSEEYDFENYPDASDESLCQFRKFGRIVDEYLGLDSKLGGPRFENRISPPRKLEPLLTREQLGNLDALIAADKSGYQIEKEGDLYRVRQQSSALALVVGNLDSLLAAARREKEQDKLCRQGRPETEILTDQDEAGDEEVISGTAPQLRRVRGQVTTYSEEGDQVRGKPKVTVELFLRSPEAVLYYLGQLVRFEKRWPKAPDICVQGRRIPIFVGRERGLDCPNGPVLVTYEGRRYLIPDEISEKETCGEATGNGIPLGCTAGRSMQALSLLNQLIGLQKSAKDLPSTGVVRTIGQ